MVFSTNIYYLLDLDNEIFYVLLFFQILICWFNSLSLWKIGKLYLKLKHDLNKKKEKINTNERYTISL